MNTYIWDSEYTLYIANAENEEKARKLVKSAFNLKNHDDFDREEFKLALLSPPQILSEWGAIVLEHSNE